jgi:plasmid stabilization system protein ParE
MAFLVKPTANAKQDARDILVWLRSQEAGETGLRWFQGMQKAIASLSEMPTRCALAPENKNFPFEVRQLLYGSRHHRYRILFTIESNTVTVLHIRHGRRNPLTH